MNRYDVCMSQDLTDLCSNAIKFSGLRKKSNLDDEKQIVYNNA